MKPIPSGAADADLQRKLLNDIRAVCKRLDVSRGTVYSLIRDGRLEAVKLASKTKITEASIQRLASCGTSRGCPRQGGGG